jgi:hypothetical protein
LLPPRPNERIVGVKTNKWGSHVWNTLWPLPMSLLKEFMLHEAKSSLFRQEKLLRDLHLLHWKEKPSAQGQP